MSEADELRAQAARIRSMAKYAQGSRFSAEMQEAKALEQKAAKIEAMLQRTKKLIAKVKIAQKQLGLDDDTYRDLLFSVTKKRSTTDMQQWELENVINRFKELGFKPKSPKKAGDRKQASDPQSKLIRGLWLDLHQAGKVRDPSERALIQWARGQFKNSKGIEALQWLSGYQKSRLIESLKQWLMR